MTKSPCKSYEPFEVLEPELSKGDKECSWFAPGVFESIKRACTKRMGKYYKKACPWGGRPDVEKEN